MKKFILLISLLALTFASCNRQAEQVDLLLQRVETIVEQYPDSALHILGYIRNPYELNEAQFAEYTLRLIQAKDRANENISSDTLIFRARDYYKRKNNPKALILSEFYCGRVMHAQGNNEKAMQLYMEARTAADAARDNYMSAMADFYIGILNLKQYTLGEEARTHFKSAVRKISSTQGRYPNELATYSSIGNTFLLEQSIDSTLSYYHKALDIAVQYNDLPQQISLNRMIGLALLGVDSLASSLEATKHALALSLQTNNTDQLPEIHLNLANIYLKENQTDSALYYATLSLGFSKIKGATYYTLSEIEESRRNYQKSLEYLQVYCNYADSIYSRRQSQNVLAVQKRYNFELIQNANRKLTIEKLWMGIGFISFALIVAIVLFVMQKKRNKDREALALAKDQIYHLKYMAIPQGKQEDENYEANKKLRDALYKQMDLMKKVYLLEGFLTDDQKMSGATVLERVNAIIYEPKENFDWRDIFQMVNALYDDYLIRLSKAYPALNEEEILICCLLKVGLNNKEIILLLKSTPNIIQKKKTSIRKKTGMKDQEHFVKQLDTLIKP